MDSPIAAAGRALAAGDALSALKRVALRNDPPALALRGIAMSQLGELARGRELLRRAARGFGSHEALARARCVVAEAEVALAMRELGCAPRTLAAAAAARDARADRANATHARLIAVRQWLLLGRLSDAAAALAALDTPSLDSPSLVAVAELAAAEIALRTLQTAPARQALRRARAAAERARVPALIAEVAEAQAALDRPAARRWQAGHEAPLRLADVEALFAFGALVVDACRRGLGRGEASRSLARRPLLFTPVRALAEGWPGDVDRDALIARAFRTRRPDETHRAPARGDRPLACAHRAAGARRGHRERVRAADRVHFFNAENSARSPEDSSTDLPGPLRAGRSTSIRQNTFSTKSYGCLSR